MLTLDDACLDGGQAQEEATQEESRTALVRRTTTRQRWLKMLSEEALSRQLDWHWEEGTAYHVMSFGDVDSLTFLRAALRQTPLDYVSISTWCMALADAEEIAEWVARGLIRRIDFYVGEIFDGGYRGARDAIERVAASTGGRVARFRNHSKVTVGISDSLSFSVESSANVNTNPRCESTVVTVDRGLALWHKRFYDGIRDFDGGFPDWQPWRAPGEEVDDAGDA